MTAPPAIINRPPRPCGQNRSHAFLTDSRIEFCSNHCVTGIREPDMLTGMTECDWAIVLEVFDAAQSSRGEPGHDDRKFLEALHYFTVHSITWRALPSEFGNWNSVWKRFWRLSRSGVQDTRGQENQALGRSRGGFSSK